MGPSPVPESILDPALAVGKAASIGSRDFEIEMGEIACIYRLPPQKHVLVLKPLKGAANAALRPFHRALAAQLRLRGLLQERSFSPHLTLAYYDPCPSIPPQMIETVRWQASELVLVDSHVGSHHYEFLGRWPLLPQAANSLPDDSQPSLF
jgi:2'-5' RNA ligase